MQHWARFPRQCGLIHLEQAFDDNLHTQRGQRVQKSVFECQVTLMQLDDLERRLLAEIKLEQDCLQLYRMPDTKGCEVREHGKFKASDFDAPMVQ